MHGSAQICVVFVNGYPYSCATTRLFVNRHGMLPRIGVQIRPTLKDDIDFYDHYLLIV